ncbi:MAG: uracil-DNA glycosylase family protein [Patescibacteria group bacterium]
MNYIKLDKINSKVKMLAGKKQYYFGKLIPNTKVMFIAEMPTQVPQNIWHQSKNFEYFEHSNTDEKFIEILQKHGFGGCYLTDIIKTATEARRPTKRECKEFVPLLLNEIEIIKPHLIIALGRSAEKILKNKKIVGDLVDEYEIKYLRHPSSVWRIKHPRKKLTIAQKWNIYELQIKKLQSKRIKTCGR